MIAFDILAHEWEAWLYGFLIAAVIAIAIVFRLAVLQERDREEAQENMRVRSSIAGPLEPRPGREHGD